ncbi:MULTISPECIES: alpha-ketoglutarate-dependent dioxygenase AlkB family protein [Prochlorococcus]|uniref:Alkylated DNA repair protein n=1 Tax=Prochlorococcus marinus (strain SARG / CCMP1375 / SS120) TaxID=167539 RepID=Q7VCD8_PROMA|nr:MULTISPECIES: alpha-ketoglutarate-dependent dioxygenase AlkB [Prochlorococcus]AAP99846.1 Alkylated DNA repair protein [Prochlorococcus marinus subsp. marinus str. CCMP1375]KGG11807.1 Alkylated DNA repair protein AlkB [Prochlorococcus marinus str. LG]KGG18779.1 Alkylated DNA repair protein AlkB [Prochlorococcus marinus str. SS2]KGG23683.1 Alkylated DNA repair protein AlkB [Prochlorococcus marinus str. SS35]KGG32081.1 Alkylated DNA repair protein AlkB [Prochlorococcus marinus str. SS51]
MDKLPFTLIRKWIKPISADKLTEVIIENIDWEQPTLKIYGKKHLVPRLTKFLGDSGIHYKYSGIEHIGKGWPGWFLPILKSVSDYCKVDYNGCLLNLYRNGDDCMGWHSDNEKELDHKKPISSLSLGASRDFFLKNRSNSSKKETLILRNGDLLIMDPSCQSNWIHSIPRRKRNQELRLNLTFRKYI